MGYGEPGNQRSGLGTVFAIYGVGGVLAFSSSSRRTLAVGGSVAPEIDHSSEGLGVVGIGRWAQTRLTKHTQYNATPALDTSAATSLNPLRGSGSMPPTTMRMKDTLREIR
ncbi:hypothetical protein BKA66DRAFT_438430 [Pyrenochaeta sp. MPI-SDFR-AT-0127]|nr:hypothetical protein BKA66DRAFT_438430 [Pyrenochaeta sp. MPI-SDFR-AT-0127]